MSLKKVKDAVVKTGEYEKNGETKGRYQNVGALFQREDGSYTMCLESIPLVPGPLWVNFFDIKSKGASADNTPNNAGQSDIDDEIPW